MESLKVKALELIIKYGPKLIVSILVIMIGFTVINIVIRTLDNTLNKNKIDRSLHSFIKSASSFMLKGIVVIVAASIMEIPVTTFIAMLSAAGLAIGLALKDSLSNFAGGILILIFRPFNVGDFIETQGYSGTVKEIQLLYTYLNTVDNRRISIPNGELSNAKVINYSIEATRRIDLVFGVSYEDDIQKVKEVLTRVIIEHPLIIMDPEPVIRTMAYKESTIDFTVKVWCKREDYWNIYYDLHEQVKAVFDAEGITIPFPQRDVNVYQK